MYKFFLFLKMYWYRRRPLLLFLLPIPASSRSIRSLRPTTSIRPSKPKMLPLSPAPASADLPPAPASVVRPSYPVGRSPLPRKRTASTGLMRRTSTRPNAMPSRTGDRLPAAVILPAARPTTMMGLDLSLEMETFSPDQYRPLLRLVKVWKRSWPRRTRPPPSGPASRRPNWSSGSAARWWSQASHITSHSHR